MNILQNVLYRILYAIVRLLAFLPVRLLRLKAHASAFVAGRILRYRYSVVIQNMSRAFPEKNYKEIKGLAREFYRHFFEIFFEVIKTAGMSPGQAAKRIVPSNPELLTELHSKGYNTIVLGGHLGNWELLSDMPLHFHFSIYTLYKPLSSPIAEKLMLRIRSHFGLKLLPMQKAGRFILGKKDFPAVYLFVGDQSPTHKDPEYCFHFLHQPSFFFNGAARLALATGSAVLYYSMRREKPGYYSVTYKPIALPEDKLSEREILERYVKYLEEDIRKDPAHWLWSHRRWKNRPEQGKASS
jgi:KDO2-lipid IV(A) lauroyltransferase